MVVQSHPLLALVDGGIVDEVGSLGGEGCVDRDEVTLRPDVFQICALNVDFLQLLTGHHRVVSDHMHAHPLCDTRHHLADTAAPHDTQRFAVDFHPHECLAVPLLVLDGHVRGGQLAGKVDQQRDGELRRAHRVASGGLRVRE